MSNDRFATAINCIDGRVQIPVSKWLKTNLGVDYVDTITEPGADKLMADGSLSAREAIRAKVLVSVNAHRSGAVAVVGHHDCTGNPVSEEEHRRMVKKGVDTVTSWNIRVRVLGLWVNDRWQVEKVADIGQRPE